MTGIKAIERFTGWRCFGVVPWLKAAARAAVRGFGGAGKSGVGREAGAEGRRADAFAHRQFRRPRPAARPNPQVELVFVPPGQRLPADAGLVVIPGSKSTIGDLIEFRENGWDRDLEAHRRRGGHVVGICGGYQMLGRVVRDPRRHRGQRDRDRGARPARRRNGDGAGKDGAQRHARIRCTSTCRSRATKSISAAPPVRTACGRPPSSTASRTAPSRPTARCRAPTCTACFPPTLFGRIPGKPWRQRRRHRLSRRGRTGAGRDRQPSWKPTSTATPSLLAR